ncbi:MAG: DUF1566 domain-containing protein [Nitrosomonadales bacterium]|nr:DUF1566 domain-containing protein [Nitrosomonadales bacterium]
MNIMLKCFATIIGLLLAIPAFAQVRYTVNGAEVTDQNTGLIWRRCSEPQGWSGSACTGTALTYTHELALTRAQSQTGWRLPSVKELASIVDRGLSNPATDSVTFPGLQADWYWSSTPYTGASSLAWGVTFRDGSVAATARTSTYYVRLVR